MNAGADFKYHLASISGDFSLEKESVRKAEVRPFNLVYTASHTLISTLFCEVIKPTVKSQQP